MRRILKSIKHSSLFAAVRPHQLTTLEGLHELWLCSVIKKIIGNRSVQLAPLVALVVFAQVASYTYAETPTVSPWQSLRPGLESIETKIQERFLFFSTITAVRASPRYFRPKVFRAAEFGPASNSAKNICNASGASACINANFFDEQRRPLGAVISRGIIHKKLHKRGGTLTGVFVTTKDSFFIVHRSKFSPENVLEALQAGPRLISNGESVPGIKTTSAQGALSIVCIDKRQNIILAKIALSFFAHYPSRIQETLRGDPFNCIEALNLDGGSSSQLFASGVSSSTEVSSERTLDSPGRDMVPVILALVPNAIHS